MEMSATEVFTNELTNILNEAKLRGDSYIDIQSRDLHIRVGGYPGKNHRMPICCNVMKKMMKSRDYIINQPPKGLGATLIIRYYIE